MYIQYSHTSLGGMHDIKGEICAIRLHTGCKGKNHSLWYMVLMSFYIVQYGNGSNRQEITLLDYLLSFKC